VQENNKKQHALSEGSFLVRPQNHSAEERKKTAIMLFPIRKEASCKNSTRDGKAVPIDIVSVRYLRCTQLIDD
jgi:hypothetical protein